MREPDLVAKYVDNGELDPVNFIHLPFFVVFVVTTGDLVFSLVQCSG